MSLAIPVQNGISPALMRIVAQLQDKRAVHQAMSDGARVEIQSHFAELSQTNRNHFGKRSTFWARMRRGTRSVASDTEGQVQMPREVAQRYFGGTIKPTGGREALTLPLHPAAYGKRAREFKDLVLIRQKAGAHTVALLIRKAASRAIGEVFYALVRSVTQKPDRTVLPTLDRIAAAASNAVAVLLRKVLPKGFR